VLKNHQIDFVLAEEGYDGTVVAYFLQASLKLMHEHTHELTLGLSFVLGAIHALEPGHGKTAMFVYLMGGRRSLWHPVIMGLSTAISHSVSLFVIAFAVHLTHHLLTHDHSHEMLVSQILQWASAVLVIGVGIWMLGSAWMGRKQQCCAHHHDAESDTCDHNSHSMTVELKTEDNHEHATPARSSFSTTALLGLAVGLLPCPSALAAYFTGLSTGQPWLAYSIIALFAGGIATSLIGVGVILQLFGSCLNSLSGRLKNVPWPYVRASLILGIGLFYATRLILAPEVAPHIHP